MSETTTNGPGWRALIIQHELPTPAGLLEPWLVERGAEVETLRIDEEDPHDLDARDYSLIISLGSEFAAYEDSIRWISHEMDLMRDAVEADVPILGVCFGGQLLARVLGGEVFRAETQEIGWLPVGTRDPELVADGPWFQWHFDTFTLPPAAKLLAGNHVGPQAYSFGRSLGVQFHPEVTPEIMDSWVRAYRHELDEHCVDADRLLEETHSNREAARAKTLSFLDRFLERVAHFGDRASSAS